MVVRMGMDDRRCVGTKPTKLIYQLELLLIQSKAIEYFFVGAAWHSLANQVKLNLFNYDIYN